MTKQQRHRARIVRKAIESIEKNLGAGDPKATLADLVRLLQIEKEPAVHEPREVRVRWIESEAAGESVTKT
jgi:hypothetical protein